MQSDVTQAEAWECFQDSSYYDMWCVRQVGDRTFGSGFHLMRGEEATALRDLLNQRADAQVEPVAAQDVAALVEASVHMAASLAAAISLLKRGGKAAKKAAPSDRMFDQMIADYEAALCRARTALAKVQKP